MMHGLYSPTYPYNGHKYLYSGLITHIMDSPL